MRRSANILIVVGLLVTSTLIAIGTKAGLTADDIPGDTIRVGVGGMRDRVHYGGTIETSTDGAPPESHPHARVFELSDVGTTLARSGAATDTLVLRERYTFDGRPKEMVWIEHVDLASRVLVRFDAMQERRSGSDYYEDVTTVFMRSGHMGISETGWQGRTLTLGQDLTPDYCIRADAGRPEVQESFRQWVAAAGWHEGRPALGVRTEHRSHDNGRSHDHTYTGMRWFVEGEAYPVFIQEWFSQRDWEPETPDQVRTWTSQEEYVLVKREPDGGPVPWQPAPSDPCARFELRDPPRSEGNVPSDADSRSWAYPPSAAVRDIRSSPAYLTWGATRPDAQIAGMSGRAVQASDVLAASGQEGQAWSVAFARGSSWARFDVERYRPDVAPVVRLVAEFDAPDPLLIMPDKPVTLGHLEGLWRNLQVPCGQPAPGFFWGVTTQATALKATRGTYDWLGLNCRIGPGPKVPESYVPGASHHQNVTGILVSALSGELRSMTSTYMSRSSALPLPAEAGGPQSTVDVQASRVQSIPASTIVVWTSSTLLVALLASLAVKFFGSGIFSGYAKIRNEELLEHPVRERIHAAIIDHPGTDAPTLQRDLGLPWSTLNYHLAVLERDHLLTSRIVGRHKHLFAAGSAKPELQHQVSVLQNQRTRAVLEHIQVHPGAHQRSLSRTFGLDPKTIAWHLRRLMDANLIEPSRQGRRTCWRATAAAEGPSAAPAGRPS